MYQLLWLLLVVVVAIDMTARRLLLEREIKWWVYMVVTAVLTVLGIIVFI